MEMQNAPTVAAPATYRPPHRYSGWYLGILCLGTTFYETVMWTYPTSTLGNAEHPGPLFGAALLVYLGVLIGILAVDWQHILTLHGHIRWRTLSWPGRIGVVLLYAFLTLLLFSQPVLYLAFAVKDTVNAWRTSPRPSDLKRAELEASLGILPGTDGECFQCHKPLQVGAVYCSYCGAATAHLPRVCPKCATVTSADAKFCPHCRTTLPAL